MAHRSGIVYEDTQDNGERDQKEVERGPLGAPALKRKVKAKGRAGNQERNALKLGGEMI